MSIRSAVHVALFGLILLAGGAPPTPAQDYPETEAGLANFLADSFKAASKDADARKQLWRDLQVPRHREWLRQVFGERESAPVIAGFEFEPAQERRSVDDQLEKFFALGAKKPGPLEIRKLSNAADAADDRQLGPVLVHMRTPTPIYVATVPDERPNYAPIEQLFFYVDGKFRRFERLWLSAMDHVPATRIRVGGAVQQGQLLHQVRPRYPSDARDAGIQGTVRLSVWLTREGVVDKIEIVKGPEPLQHAALTAVSQWRYRPTLLRGVRVEVVTTVDVVFALVR